MNARGEQLRGDATAAANAAAAAAEWFDANRDYVGAQASMLAQEFRGDKIAARRLARAAPRPMCVGVFGESQSGKSYLISALARHGTEPLFTCFGSREIDFLKLNPESGGENEATGLVTRFSIRKLDSPVRFPVVVRLLSQSDLIKILANTYLLDFDLAVETPPDQENLRKALAAARARIQGRPLGTLSRDDILELQQYFDREFVGRQTTLAFKQSGFWVELEDLAPQLRFEDCIKLLEFLWGAVPAFTTVYRQLYRVLESLGFAGQAYCPIETIDDRSNTILSVDTLRGILEDGGTQIEIQATDGKTVRVPRAQLAAIISELVVQIRDKPADFFEHTDLLDFPGLRTRLNIQMSPDAYLKEKGDLGMQELFRRGKVGFLFDHYCTEQELTAMLLCVQPGNQSTRVLPPMVLKWIHASHGAGPSERDKVATALFLVLTKFDKRFAQSRGREAESTDELWTKAIDVALLDFFGKDTDNWPLNWKTGHPFQNVYWLRNPNFRADGLMQYRQDGELHEIGIAQPTRIAAIKAEYLRNAFVQRHILNADRAWDAAFELNDGGVSYLISCLTPVCRPEIKNDQIAARLGELKARMLARTSGIYVSSDGAGEAEKRKTAASEAVRALLRAARDMRFGHFLNELQMDAFDLQYALYWPDLKAGGSAGGLALGPDESSMEKTIFGDTAPANSKSRGDRASRLAEYALEHWAGRLRSLTQDDRRLSHLTIDPLVMSTVVRELLDGIRQLRIDTQLADVVRSVLQTVDASASSVLKPAMACAEGINGFVWHLGQDNLPPQERAVRKSGAEQRSVFAKRSRIDELIDLPEHGTVYYQPFIEDWLISFRDLAVKNTAGEDSRAFSSENIRLGEIRKSFM